MSITRTRLQFENHYVQIPNAWLRDQRLSRRARGLLAEIMTHDVGWHLTTETLTEAGPEGRDAIRGAIIELEAAGYLTRVTRREGTKFAGVDYVLSDPFAEVDRSKKADPSPENPTLENRSDDDSPAGKPATGKPSPENPQLRRPLKNTIEEKKNNDTFGSLAPHDGICFACGQPAELRGKYCSACTASGKDSPMLNCVAHESEGCRIVGRRRRAGQQFIKCREHKHL